MLLQAFTDFWAAEALHNRTGDWIIFCALVAIALFLRRPIAGWVSHVAAGFVKRTTDGRYGKLFRSLVQRPLEGLMATVLIYLALNRLVWPFDYTFIHRERKDKVALDITVMDVLDKLALFTAIVFGALVLSRVLDFIFRVQGEKARREAEHARLQILPLLRDLAKILLWTAGIFWVLGGVFGMNIPALITGLGIGGVAIALAAKESVENFFAAFTILADKPFGAGDTVKLGPIEGSVERIGFRSTRLRGSDGSLFIIPNKKLVDESLENLSERASRRVMLRIPVKYGVSPEGLRAMLKGLEDAARGVPRVTAPVKAAVESFGEVTFGVLLTYYIPLGLSPEEDLDVRQAVAEGAYGVLAQATTEKAE